MPVLRHARVPVVLAALGLLAGCATTSDTRKVNGLTPTNARALIQRLVPGSAADREGWATDLYAGLASNDIAASPENICAAIAVTEQESTFQADPPVPNLPAIAWKALDEQADRANVPKMIVRAALKVDSPDGRTYKQRIDEARTERDLSEIFEDLVDVVPGGKRFLADRNPVHTGGPMQVSVAFAEGYTQDHSYPYPVERSIRHEVFTRRGGLYFGIAHLLKYPADYDAMLYRFADYNAGHYASRNAAFQNAVSIVSGVPLDLDGDLVRYGSGREDPGATELAVRTLRKRLKMDDDDIRDDLEAGGKPKFVKTDAYKKVFALADELERQPVPRALVPTIRLQSPKITRELTTKWFAERVNDRYQGCLSRAGNVAQ